MVHEASAPLEPGCCPTPGVVPFLSTSSSELTPAQPAPENDPTLPIPDRWPSQIAQSNSTMWLLPPSSDQSSAIAQLLRTEIQSHNITREMLHATETRRLQAVQNCNRLLDEAHSWATAHNNLTSALNKCSEECSRLSAENVSLKTQLKCVNMQVSHQINEGVHRQLTTKTIFRLDKFAPKDKQIQLLREKLSRRFSKESQVESMSVDSNPDASTKSMKVAQLELEVSPSPYSPEG